MPDVYQTDYSLPGRKERKGSKGSQFCGFKGRRAIRWEIAAAYDKAGADELVFLDITASSDARNTVVSMVRQVAETVFIPFTVGGGIRSIEGF